MLIAKVPGMTERAFENFLRVCGYNEFKKLMMYESNVSTLGIKYPYYQIYGSKY